jgi:hypothetical protein
LRAALLTLTAGALAPGLAFAQNSYQQTVNRRLAAFAQVITPRGYAPQGPPLTGSLADDTQQGMLVSLSAGVRYVIAGACDEDCSDFDLRILAPDGAMLDEDVETDDRPVLEFTAPVTGQYRLMAMMPGCSTSPCYWGAQIFGR